MAWKSTAASKMGGAKHDLPRRLRADTNTLVGIEFAED